ncbi:hypothetical protein HYFRA_00007338 [Hymenoscyphus fraxineus]|uniref:Tat pathway signal sequence n=1 Tax=Hymenoscyphus fraxineus TaxID=746836 RepID=A0A9N9KSX0_9HELO|nr:hypothetical protein HYFRA_00007338 [Hymenoscyphus fraxineus]
MSPWKEFRYDLLRREEDASNPRRSLTRYKKIPYALFYGLTSCLCLSLVGNCILLYFSQQLFFKNPQPSWSPTIDAIPWSMTKFNGSLIAKSSFVGQNDQVDAMWDQYTSNPWVDGTSIVLSVSEEEIRSSSRWSTDEELSTSTAVALSPQNGGGYMATIEMPHQLHCLNILRKNVYREHYQDDPYFKSGDTGNHTAHCIEMLRQVLECRSDSQLILFHWVQGWEGPVPDFNTWHRCRNPDTVLDWAANHSAPLTERIVKPQGVAELPDRP